MIFALIAFTVLASVYGYIGWRLIAFAGFGPLAGTVSWLVFGLFLILPFLSVTLNFRGINGVSVDVLNWMSYIGMGFISLVFVMLAIRDFPLLVAGVGKKALAVSGFFRGGSPAPRPVDPGRHRFLVHTLNMGILGVAAALTGYGVFQARRVPKPQSVKVPVKGLPPELAGFRMVQISDIHVGPTIKRDYVQAVVDTVNALNPDAVFLTGDLVDGLVDNLRDEVAPLAQIKAQYGAYFVTGNHEYYSGVEAWTDEVKRLGFTVLHNDHVILPYHGRRILLAGVPDFSGGRFHRDHVSNPAAALDGAGGADVKLLLAHQPRSIYAAAEAGYDVMLSGHTHGGQYIPWNFFVGLQQPYTLGLHKHEDTWVYVSRGTGYWGPPLRIGIPNEITLLTLTDEA